LKTYFNTHSIAQSSGLDDQGSTNSSGEKILTETVSGKKEQLYWEKVPEKIRRQAVERAVQKQFDSQSGGVRSTIHDSECHEGGE